MAAVDSTTTLVHAFAAVGLLATAVVATWSARLFYHACMRRASTAQFQTPTRDGWALVTGCTSGIGEGFAEVLARQGWNLLLVSRSEPKLRELAATLKAKHPTVKTKHVVSDAASLAPSEIDRVRDACQSSEVSLRILVNNVGVSTGHAGPLHECTPEQLTEMIRVNCQYPTLLTHALLPLLKRGASPKHRTCIIDVASQTSFLHVPLCTGYSASKSYNLGWSHALREELRDDHVEVLCLTPGLVATAMSGAQATSLMTATPIQCATAALNAIGLRDHCGHWCHHLANALFLCMPASWRGTILLREMQSIRAAEQAKKRSDSKPSKPTKSH